MKYLVSFLLVILPVFAHALESGFKEFTIDEFIEYCDLKNGTGRDTQESVICAVNNYRDLLLLTVEDERVKKTQNDNYIKYFKIEFQKASVLSVEEHGGKYWINFSNVKEIIDFQSTKYNKLFDVK